MDYIDITLPITNLEPGQDPYPDRARHDIVTAVYHDQYPEKDNPDIAALPPRLSDVKIAKMCGKGYPGYNRDAVKEMKLSERLIALDALKDYVRVYLPYYGDFARRLTSCLLSAYRGREFAVGKEHFRMNQNNVDPFTRSEIGEEQVLSVSSAIGSNVQCMALVGVAGAGKSTCNEFITSPYPHGIFHTCLPNGYKYLQIPILKVNAADIADTKSFFINLADIIDNYIGHGKVYRDQMTKKRDISKMINYFSELAAQFHIGMIIIDEVQMIATKKNIFSYLLSVSNSSHVSLCLIGTESSMPILHDETWFKRRFGELGLVTAEMGTHEKQVISSVLRQIWHYQWTYSFTPEDEPDEKSMRMLVDASMGNIDLLTTLFVKAQRIALKDGKKGCLTPEVVERACKSVLDAKNLLKNEKDVIAKYTDKEKDSLKQSMRIDLLAAKNKEAQAVQKAAEEDFILKAKALDDIIYRIGQVSVYGPKQIEKAFEQIVENGKDLMAMDGRQRAMLVLSYLQQEEISRSQKGRNREKSKNKVKEIRKKKTVQCPEDELKEALSGGINDITNLQSNVS